MGADPLIDPAVTVAQHAYDAAAADFRNATSRAEKAFQQNKEIVLTINDPTHEQAAIAELRLAQAAEFAGDGLVAIQNYKEYLKIVPAGTSTAKDAAQRLKALEKQYAVPTVKQ